jgi:hypothetical protein
MTIEKASFISDRGLFILPRLGIESTIGGMSADDVTSQILTFLTEIGLTVREGEVSDSSFLPGIEVENGGLIVDRARLKYPGDLLHEAGHLAVVPASVRSRLSGEVKTPGEHEAIIEVMALLWSYAASVHLDLDPGVVFHADGYRGHSQGLLNSFQLGLFPGVHHLEVTGMTVSRPDPLLPEVLPFPVMRKWLRD